MIVLDLTVISYHTLPNPLLARIRLNQQLSLARRGPAKSSHSTPKIKKAVDFGHMIHTNFIQNFENIAKLKINILAVQHPGAFGRFERERTTK